MKENVATMIADLSAYFLDQILNGDFAAENPSSIGGENQFITIVIDGYKFRWFLTPEKVSLCEDYPVRIDTANRQDELRALLWKAYTKCRRAELIEERDQINAKLAELDKSVAA